MEYDTTLRVNDEDKVVLSVAEFPNQYEMARRHASAKLTVPQALALAAELIQAANTVMERELEGAEK